MRVMRHTRPAVCTLACACSARSWIGVRVLEPAMKASPAEAHVGCSRRITEMWAREKEWQDEWKGGRFALLWTVEMCAHCSYSPTPAPPCATGPPGYARSEQTMPACAKVCVHIRCIGDWLEARGAQRLGGDADALTHALTVGAHPAPARQVGVGPFLRPPGRDWLCQ